MSRQTVISACCQSAVMLVAVLVGFLSAFVEIQAQKCPSDCPYSPYCRPENGENFCCPAGQYWNDSTTPDDQTTTWQTNGSWSTDSTPRNESHCFACDDSEKCLECNFTTTFICTKCAPGLELTEDRTSCKPEPSSFPIVAVVIGVVCGVLGAAAIAVVFFLVCRCASRHRPDVMPRRRLPGLEELDELPTAVVAESSGRNPLKKLSMMVRPTRYTPGPESQRHVGSGGAPDPGAVGTQRPTVASVHYDVREQVTSVQESPAQSTVAAPAGNGAEVRSGRAGRAIPAVPNGNSKPSPLPIRPERPPSMMPDSSAAEDGEVYANSPAINEDHDDDAVNNNIRGHVNASYNQQQQQQHADDDDDGDGEVYANNDELTSPAAADVTSSQIDSDVIDLLPAASAGCEYVNVEELRRQMHQQQQRNPVAAPVQDAAVDDADDREVYENVVVPAVQPAKQKPRPVVRPRPR